MKESTQRTEYALLRYQHTVDRVKELYASDNPPTRFLVDELVIRKLQLASELVVQAIEEAESTGHLDASITEVLQGVDGELLVAKMALATNSEYEFKKQEDKL